MNNYLIPANSKKSMLILGYFTMFDLIVFGTGCLFTLVLLFTVKSNNIGGMILMILPALVTGFLVMPVLYYHNVMTFIANAYRFYTSRRVYIWKGWCVRDVHRGE